jgi:hypothetical protein
LAQVGTVHTNQQLSTGRYVDAHEIAGEDYRLVTRPRQDDDTQRWVLLPVGDGSVTLRQLSNGRFVDAHEIAGEDYQLVTRERQDDNSQRWIFDNV